MLTDNNTMTHTPARITNIHELRTQAMFIHGLERPLTANLYKKPECHTKYYTRFAKVVN